MTQNKINIALYQPDIPQNTAAIIRTAACLGVKLMIIQPSNFVFGEKKVGRIYMDYLKHCELEFYESTDDFFDKNKKKRVILFTTKSSSNYFDFKFKRNDILLFGNETSGVSNVLYKSLTYQVTIPMNNKTRSLNLASSVSIGISEALRQLNVK